MSDSFEKAKIQYNLGKYDRAAAALLEELAENPENALAQSQLAYCQLAMGQMDLALESAREGVRLRPDWEFPYCILAKCHIALDQWSLAQKAIGEALRLSPQDLNTLPLAAEIAAHFQLWVDASGLLDRALEIDPNHLDSRNLKTYVLANSGKKVEAHSFNEETLKYHPENGFAQMMMGFKLWELGKGKEAEARLDEALRLEPQSDSFRRYKIWFLKSKSKPLYFLFAFGLQESKAFVLFYCIAFLMLCIVFVESFDFVKFDLKGQKFFVPFVWVFVFIYFIFWIGGPLSDFFLAFREKQLYYPKELLLSRWCASLLALSLLGIPLAMILSWDWWVLGGFAFLLPQLTLFPVMGFLTLSEAKKRWIIHPLTALMGLLFLFGAALLTWAIGVSPTVSIGFLDWEFDARIWGIRLWEGIFLVAIPMGYLVKKVE